MALTPAQQAAQEKRAQRAQNVAEGRNDREPEPAGLPAMLGQGRALVIGDRSVEIRPFALKNLARAGKLIAECPDLLVTAALAAATGEGGAAGVTETLGRLTSQFSGEASGVGALSEDTITYAGATLALNVSEENAEAMAALIALAVSRDQPDITQEEIAESLDVPTFVEALATILRVNDGLRARF